MNTPETPIESTPGAQAAPQAVPQAQSSSSSSTLPLVIGVGGGLLLAAAVFFGPDLMANFGGSKPRVVVVDAVRIVEAASKQPIDMSSPEAAVKQGEAIARKLNDEMTAYASKGAIVIVKQAVLAAPAATDVTEEIAARIGVDVSRVPGR